MRFVVFIYEAVLSEEHKNACLLDSILLLKVAKTRYLRDADKESSENVSASD